MEDPDYQVRITKDGNLKIVNPQTSQAIANIPFTGTIMKACREAAAMAIPSGAPGGASVQAKPLHTVFSFGNFTSSQIPGVFNMQQNPKLKDSGYELQEIPGQSYPRLQHWKMYGIFTMDLSRVDPKFAMFQVANREQEPIRLSVRLTKPWGQEPLQYILQDDRVPLYPWDSESFDFARACPFTGGAPAPIAYIEKSGDRTRMSAAWVKQSGILSRTL